MPSAMTSGRTPATKPPAGSGPSVQNFDRIVDDYQRRLYGFALRMTGNREDAEEIVQDAFVRAYRALGKMSSEQLEESIATELAKLEAMLRPALDRGVSQRAQR